MGACKKTIDGLRSLRPSGLMCFDHADGRVRVVDADGTVVAIISMDKCHPPASESLLKEQWRLRARSMAAQVKNPEYRAKSADPWVTKCSTWVCCLRSREFDKWRKRKASGGRFFNARNRASWPEAAIRMKFQLKNKGERKLRHKANPWMPWAETCSKNHNRKELARVGKNQRAVGDGRRAELQMRFVRSRTVPCHV
jgi:hypothetical protein